MWVPNYICNKPRRYNIWPLPRVGLLRLFLEKIQQGGPTERMMSQNVNKPLRTIRSEAYILLH